MKNVNRVKLTLYLTQRPAEKKGHDKFITQTYVLTPFLLSLFISPDTKNRYVLVENVHIFAAALFAFSVPTLISDHFSHLKPVLDLK